MAFMLYAAISRARRLARAPRMTTSCSRLRSWLFGTRAEEDNRRLLARVITSCKLRGPSCPVHESSCRCHRTRQRGHRVRCREPPGGPWPHHDRLGLRLYHARLRWVPMSVTIAPLESDRPFPFTRRAGDPLLTGCCWVSSRSPAGLLGVLEPGHGLVSSKRSGLGGGPFAR
jgi:hypothetical protein